MADLTLPGDIPGLLRRGSPVVATIAEYMDGWADGTRGIYVMPDSERPTRACIAVESMPSYGEFLAWPLLSRCTLDLTDATGRAHASMWLGAHAGLLHGTSSDVRPVPGGNILIVEGGPRSRIWHSRDVPAIAHLDPDDLRTIADGSRWVDAEALRLVCLHVAGREVTHG